MQAVTGEPVSGRVTLLHRKTQRKNGSYMGSKSMGSGNDGSAHLFAWPAVGITLGMAALRDRINGPDVLPGIFLILQAE